MKTFSSYLLFESKRFVGKRNITLALILLFFLLYFVQTGINQYRFTLDGNEEFKRLEQLKVGLYVNYTQYGAAGIRMLFSPSPISIFFSNTGIISNMSAFLDSGPRLRIYNSLKGKYGFVIKKFGFTDFSGIILYFGSLLALLYGFDSFHHKEYLKFLSSIANFRKVFVYIMVSRAILLLLMMAAFMGLSLLLLIVNKLPLDANDYSQFLNFCVVSFLMLLFFFILGSITSTMKSKVAGLMSMTLIWFILVFFIPAAVHAIIASRAESITPVFQNELSQFQNMSNFEQRAIKQEGIVKKEGKMPQSEIDLMESYWNNEYKNILDIESEIQSEMKSNISVFQSLSVVFPSTFYFSVTNEISSKGYDNLIDFYKTAQELKRNFFRYYINQIYYFSNYSKVKSFINKDENMFYARSRIPENYSIGIGILLVYMVLLSAWSYQRYKRAVFGFSEDWRGGLKNPRLDLKKFQLRPFYIEDERFGHQMYNLLSGHNQAFKDHGFQDKILIEDSDIVMEPQKDEFLYLCHLSAMPGDVTAGALVKLIIHILGARKKRKGETGKIPITPTGTLTFDYARKSINQLERQEQEHLLLALLRHETRPIYLINDVGKGLSINFILQLKKQMEMLAKDGALVIYLTTDYHPPVRTLRKEETFFNHTKWTDVVGSLEGLAGDEFDENEPSK